MSIGTLTAPVLLVVDIQTGTLPNARTIPAETLIERAAHLVAAFRDAHRPVYFTVSTGTPPGITDYGTGGREWPSADTELAPGLTRAATESILLRSSWSAFAGSDLEKQLRDAAVREVVIVGLATTFGVESTARQAADLGFDVIVVADAISDPDPAGHERSITRVFPALGRVTETAELVAVLGGTP